MIHLEIPLPPVPWQASIKGKYTFYDPKEKEKRAARFFIKEQYKGVPLDCYVILFFGFHFKTPKSASKKKKEAMLKEKIFPTRSDCTNLQKLYEDCLKGIVIEDDRKVVKTFSQKLYKECECVKINIYTFEEFEQMKEIKCP